MYRGLKSAQAIALATLVCMATPPHAAAQGLLGDIVGGGADDAEDSDGLLGDTIGTALASVEELVEGLTQGSGSGGIGAGAGQFVTEQEAALRAVRTGQALPLDEILFIAQLNYDGDVIDVHLLRVGSILLYQLTFLAPDGEVFDTLFYAATGIPVQSQN